MKKIIVLIAFILFCSTASFAQKRTKHKKLNKRSYNVGRSGDKWERKQRDKAHGRKGKMLTFYDGGYGFAAPCPVYGSNPVRRDVMKRQFYGSKKRKQ